MSSAKKVLRRAMGIALVLGTVPVVVSLSASSDSLVDVNEACASGACCFQIGAVCPGGGGLAPNQRDCGGT